MSNSGTSDWASVLEAKGLQRHYEAPGAVIEVIRGVDFAVGAGESVSIRGESGCGKTTLLNLLSGLERPGSGQVFWNGESVLEKSPTWQSYWRSIYLGLIFQAYYLVPELNALENVLLAARIGKRRIGSGEWERARMLLERVGLGARQKHLPSRLSGGERQRVAIARALMNHPPVILADEPTGNLDEKTALHIRQLLLELCEEEKVGLVLVTHSLEFASQTDRQLVLNHGFLDEA